MSRADPVTALLSEIAMADRNSLLERWQDAFGVPAPKNTSVQLLRKALAHDVQCKAFGGLAATTRRELLSAAGGNRQRASALPRVDPRTQFVREWNGRTYRVEVVPEGFRMDTTVYPSLTAIARRITGTNWSGPRFFGLRTRSVRQSGNEVEARP